MVSPIDVSEKNNNFQNNEQVGGLRFSRGMVNASAGSTGELRMDNQVLTRSGSWVFDNAENTLFYVLSPRC